MSAVSGLFVDRACGLESRRKSLRKPFLHEGRVGRVAAAQRRLALPLALRLPHSRLPATGIIHSGLRTWT